MLVKKDIKARHRLGIVVHAFNSSTEFQASLVHTVSGQTGAHRETLSQMNKVEREVVNLTHYQSKIIQTCFYLANFS